MLNNYPNYEVERFHDFKDLYNRFKNFGDSIAFENNGVEITYNTFSNELKSVASSLKTKSKFYVINCADKYLYALSYMAVVLSGNVALVQPYSTTVLDGFKEFDIYKIIDDEFVLSVKNADFTGYEFESDSKAICTILCSSGTTATPKAVALSQHGMCLDLVYGMQKFNYYEGGKFVSILPYSHAFGIVCDLMGALYSRSTLCLAYNTLDFLSKLPKFNPTTLNIPPALIEAIISQIEVIGDKTKVVGNSLKKILSGGAGTPVALCEKAEKYGFKVYGCYGLSEGGPCVAVNRDNYYKYGSSGVMLDCCTPEISSDGEIILHGENIMLGYLDKKGNLIPSNGVHKTGDIGYVDEDGFIYIEGRIDDTIVFSDGTKLMPNFVEGLIKNIEGVNESVVFLKDNVLTAVVSVKNESFIEGVKKSVLTTSFGGYFVKKVEVTTDALKKNAMGKLQRKLYQKG